MSLLISEIMSTAPTVLGFVRPRAGLDPASQHKTLLAAGVPAERTYEQGRASETLDAAIRALRPGDLLAVARAYLLVDVRRIRGAAPRREALWSIMGRIEAAGAVLWDVESDRKTATNRTRDAIIRDAIETLARSRVPGIAKPRGRPKREWPEATRAALDRHWKSLDHNTDDDALAAIAAEGVVIGKTDAWRIMGASGRSRRRRIK